MKKLKCIIDIDSYGATIEVADNDNTFMFNFGIGYSIDSCSLIDIHGFTMEYNGYMDNAVKIDTIKRLFKAFIRKHTSGKKVTTILFTTINGQELIDEAVESGELFTLVKSFTNRNSGNINHLYISNEGSL